jgi:hypothetical protein
MYKKSIANQAAFEVYKKDPFDANNKKIMVITLFILIALDGF